MDIASKTLSTIIFLQEPGKNFDRLFKVRQYEALVCEANREYFFEWKNVKSLFVAVFKSVTLKILSLLKLSLFLIPTILSSFFYFKGSYIFKKRI